MAYNLVPEEISLLVSSDPSAGAQNVSTDGSSFTINLSTAIEIPKEAKNVNVSVLDATVWNTTPNVIEGENNKLVLDDGKVQYELEIPTGLYDLPALQSAVYRELEAKSLSLDPLTVELQADSATQRVIIRLGIVGWSVDFTGAGTLRDILGWSSEVVGPSTSAPQNFTAPAVANFAVIQYYKLHSDLTPQGFLNNDDYDGSIARILITARPGSQIIYEPLHPAKVTAQFLAGAKKRSIRFWLTDQANNLVNTNSEIYSARIRISYMQPEHIAP